MENSAEIISSDEKMADSQQEESSWTFYIREFMRDQNNNEIYDDDDEKSCFSSEFESPSLVSDAASSSIKKFKDHDQNITKELLEEDHLRVSSGSIIISKPNSFKKQKNKTMHDLEDTASSPVNSPKISFMNHFMNHKEKDHEMEVSEVKRNIFAKGRVLTAERDTEYTDLKKRSCG